MTQTPVDTPRSLGICVTTRGIAGHVLGLVSAAVRAQISPEIFLTGEGVHLVRERHFPELLSSARVSVCDVSLRAAGLEAGDVAGLTDKDFVTQWRNAEMVERCDRYLVL
ncbi:MAG: DsrE family protein [bacterium]|nr:DsrE family protein [bacterium]